MAVAHVICNRVQLRCSKMVNRRTVGAPLPRSQLDFWFTSGRRVQSGVTFAQLSIAATVATV